MTRSETVRVRVQGRDAALGRWVCALLDGRAGFTLLPPDAAADASERGALPDVSIAVFEGGERWSPPPRGDEQPGAVVVCERADADMLQAIEAGACVDVFERSCSTPATLIHLIRRAAALGRAARELAGARREVALLRAALAEGEGFVLSAEGTIAAWSEGAARALGHAAEAVLGSRVDALLAPSDRADGGWTAGSEPVARDGRASPRLPLRRGDGSSAPEAGNLTALRDERGALLGFRCAPAPGAPPARGPGGREPSAPPDAFAALDDVPALVAVLDAHGRILFANAVWLRLACAHRLASCFPPAGESYLDACDGAARQGVAPAREAAEGIRAVLSGARERFALDYPCHATNPPGWYRMQVARTSSLRGDACAIVSHMDVTEVVRAQRDDAALLARLHERVKELRALHAAATVLRQRELSLDGLLAEFAATIPPAFQSPETTAVCVCFGERRHATAGYRETPWTLRVDLATEAGDSGHLEVVALTDDPSTETGEPFIEEERALVASLAEMLRTELESRAATARLRRSEEQFRVLFQQNPQAMYVFDVETLGFLAANDRALEQYGYSREEFLSLTMADIRPVDDLPALREAIARAGERLQPDGIWRHCRADGTPLSAEIYSQGMQFGGRKARLVLAIDVTGRVQIEEALRASEARLRTILDTAPECVKVVALDGRLREMNAAGLRMVGAARVDEVAGRPIRRWVHPDDQEAFDALHTGCEEGEAGQLEFRLLDAEGGHRWVQSLSTPLRNAAGTIEAVLSVTRDVTDVREAQRALVEAERRLRLILNSVGEGVLGLDASGRVNFANPAACELLGCVGKALLGQPSPTLRPADREAEGGAAAACPVRLTLADGITRRVTGEVIHRPDGSGFPAESICAAIRNEAGEVEGAVLTFVDLSERVEAERHRQALSQQTELMAEDLVKRNHELRRANAELARSQALLRVAPRR